MRIGSRARAPFSIKALAIIGLLAVMVTSMAAPPAAADWQNSKGADVTASIIDLTIVRPFATMKVIIGALMFPPAALFSLPMGKEGIEGAYETFIEVPAEYAFERDIGEL